MSDALTDNQQIAEFFQTSRLARRDDVVFSEFETMVAYLREPTTIHGFKNMFLQVFHHASTGSGPAEEPTVDVTINIRKIIAAYMNAFFPAHVFETMGIRETTLRTRALDMLARLEELGQHWVAHGSFDTVPVEKCIAFVVSVQEYLKAFDSWREQDQPFLVQKIRNAVHGLLGALRHLMQESVEDETRLPLIEEIRTKTACLMAKLTQLVAPEQRAAFIRELLQEGLTDPDIFVAQTANAA
jgi:hypothetical protein